MGKEIFFVSRVLQNGNKIAIIIIVLALIIVEC
jgi:hypothetical protein